MQLTVRDVARLLNASEKTIYRWIQEGSIPAYKIHDHYRFNRSELLEWATAQRINVSAELLEEPDSGLVQTGVSLSQALEAGGILYRIEGADKPAVLRAVVKEMRLPEEVDRGFLVQVLLAREAMESTAIGEGIAIPHVRNPIVLHVPKPTVTLAFLERPIDFGALDRQPVFCLFTLVSPTVRAHLHLLSRIAFGMRDLVFRDTIRRQGTREEILSAARNVESQLATAQQLNGDSPAVSGEPQP